MRKFFIFNQELISGEKYLLSKEDSNHYVKVLRGNINNEKIVICDGQNNDFMAHEIKIEDNISQVLLGNKIEDNNEPNINIHLYLALIKSDKFEIAIQKCVELGVRQITPVITERTIISLDETKINKKVIRWNKIALEACKQCQRSYIPSINKPIKFNKAIEKNNNNSILAYVDENKFNLKSCLDKIENETINIFIGPEGGYTNKEILFAKNNNILISHLGKRILRAETAAITATSLILFHKNQID